MLETEERKRIVHIIGICDRVKKLTDEMGKEMFVNKEGIHRDCLCFDVINAGYVLEDLQIECPGKYDDMPLGNLMKTRDMVDYRFDEVNFNELWDTLVTVFSPIKEYLENVLKNNY